MPAVLRFLALIAGSVPWRSLRVLGAALGWLAGSVLRVRRAHVENAMRVAGVTDPAAQARAMYRSLGTSVWELLRVAARGAETTARVAFDGPSRAQWELALAQGRGVVVAASHTGNWDLGACAVARDVELLVITKRLRVDWLDAFWQSTRAARGVLLATGPGALGEARRVLARGGAVAMVIDQVPISLLHAAEVEFLGRPALVDRAAAVLAASSGAPLVVVAGRRGTPGDATDHVLVVLDVLQPPSRSSRAGRAWVAGAVLAATRGLDSFVRAHPSQWLWLHRRWKRLDRCSRDATMPSSCPPESFRPPRLSTPSSSRDASSRAG